jgi:hypothetical protein
MRSYRGADLGGETAIVLAGESPKAFTEAERHLSAEYDPLVAFLVVLTHH